MSIQNTRFGATEDGTAIDLFTITNRNKLVTKIMSYGLCITELHVPDKSGTVGNIVCGFDNVEPYLKGCPYFGATIGRYANRIAKGKFRLDGKEYTLPINNAPNSLHGGIKGFDKVVWKTEASGDNSVGGTYLSKDG